MSSECNPFSAGSFKDETTPRREGRGEAPKQEQGIGPRGDDLGTLQSPFSGVGLIGAAQLGCVGSGQLPDPKPDRVSKEAHMLGPQQGWDQGKGAGWLLWPKGVTTEQGRVTSA